MREYIRHPTSIPINIFSNKHIASDVIVQNLSNGGLSFLTHQPVKVGELIDFAIPITTPDYHGQGVVVWRRDHSPDEYEVGMRFTSCENFFRARMVEQVCQIEEYRHTICANYGRLMSTEEAALEWISKYAQSFDVYEQ